MPMLFYATPPLRHFAAMIIAAADTFSLMLRYIIIYRFRCRRRLMPLLLRRSFSPPIFFAADFLYTQMPHDATPRLPYA